jgi:hypothetical protein
LNAFVNASHRHASSWADATRQVAERRVELDRWVVNSDQIDRNWRRIARSTGTEGGEGRDKDQGNGTLVHEFSFKLGGTQIGSLNGFVRTLDRLQHAGHVTICRNLTIFNI